jgi:hypothetical protein
MLPWLQVTRTVMARAPVCRTRGNITCWQRPLPLSRHYRPGRQPDLIDLTMSQVPSTSNSSSNFETVFVAALEDYKKQTKKDIASHPLAAQLNSCGSPNAVLSVLKSQVQTFDSSESANERWTKLLDPTVNVLCAFSGFISNIAGPVCRETLSRFSPTLT